MTDDTLEQDGAPVLRPCYPIGIRAMSDVEVAEAREFVETAAKIDQSGKVFRHLCLLLADHDAHAFSKDEALLLVHVLSLEEVAAAARTVEAEKALGLLDKAVTRLRAAWLL